MKNKAQNKRTYARVVFDRTARLKLDDKVFEGGKIRDLSLIGLFLEGSFDLKPGDICTVEIQETGPSSSLALIISATVVRVESGGIGLKFVDMKQDAYMFLQTMILYATQDPVSVAEEFLEDFPPKNIASK